MSTCMYRAPSVLSSYSQALQRALQLAGHRRQVIVGSNFEEVMHNLGQPGEGHSSSVGLADAQQPRWLLLIVHTHTLSELAQQAGFAHASLAHDAHCLPVACTAAVPTRPQDGQLFFPPDQFCFRSRDLEDALTLGLHPQDLISMDDTGVILRWDKVEYGLCLLVDLLSGQNLINICLVLQRSCPIKGWAQDSDFLLTGQSDIPDCDVPGVQPYTNP